MGLAAAGSQAQQQDQQLRPGQQREQRGQLPAESIRQHQQLAHLQLQLRRSQLEQALKVQLGMQRQLSDSLATQQDLHRRLEEHGRFLELLLRAEEQAGTHGSSAGGCSRCGGPGGSDAKAASCAPPPPPAAIQLSHHQRQRDPEKRIAFTFGAPAGAEFEAPSAAEGPEPGPANPASASLSWPPPPGVDGALLAL